MQPNGHGPARDADQHAALHRLRRAQLAEARRIRQVAMRLMRTRLTWPMLARTSAFPCERIGQLLGQRDHSTVLHGIAIIAARLTSGRGEDAYLRQMVRALDATLDATYEAEALPHRRPA